MADQPVFPPFRDDGSAPFIYFDLVGCQGILNGAIQIELVARTLNPKQDGGVDIVLIPSARLRCSPTAAANLRDAISTALDLLQQQVTQGAQTVPPPPGRLN